MHFGCLFVLITCGGFCDYDCVSASPSLCIVWLMLHVDLLLLV